MLKALGNDAKREGLHAGDGFIAVLAVAHHPCKRRHFGQPTAVILAFKFDRERHARTVPSGPLSHNGTGNVAGPRRR